LEYNIGNIIKIRFPDDAFPTVQEEFELWKNDMNEGKQVDISVEKGKVEDLGIIIDECFSVSEGFFCVRNSSTICSISDGRIIVDGNPSHDFFEAKVLQPTMNRHFVRRGWCVSHCSAVSYNGNTIVFPAFGGTGKTGLMLEFMNAGAKYIADDHLLLGQNGRCVFYPRHVHLLEYNFGMFPELFEMAFPDDKKRRIFERRLELYRTGLRLHGDNVISRMLRRNLTSRYYFECRIRPEKLFSESRIQKESKITHTFFLLKKRNEKMIKRSDSQRLAQLAAISSWMNECAEQHNLVAKVAGCSYHTPEDRKDILDQCFQKSECYEVYINGKYDRKGLDKIFAEIRAIVE
jgi:hypothetical protein